ncbi:DUF418 domain-containing protein [Brachybacterium sp. YJGR34]|uniref:DUF418 domain-containing protein n=1 Tax=Brachybacterium sp. YJGR34 TaxID=2059911 RepID=UPI0018E5C82D|nr:DUF418 domain-containing protein [Brachybacterium sp. YJGR34]
MTNTPPTDTDRTAAPAPRRLLAPDMSRGAMLLMIAAAYATVYAGSHFGADVSQLPLADRVTAFASALLLDNRAFPLFAILFGYWVARGTDRRSERDGIPRQAYVRLLRRAGALLLFGVIHAVLVFPGEILSSYGIALLLVGWLLLLSTRALVVALGVLLVGSALLNTLFAVAYAYAAATDPVALAAVPGYLTAGDWAGRILAYPVTLVFMVLGYPLLLLVVTGFLAGRLRLFEDVDRHRRTLRLLATLGIAVSVGGALPAALASVGALDAGWATIGLLNGLQILTGVAGGLGYASLFTLIGTRVEQHPGRFARALAAMGSRSLTFYLLHSVLIAATLHSELIGVGAHVGPFGAVAVATGVWLLGLLAASALERAGRPGPLDALMRRLVDGAPARS